MYISNIKHHVYIYYNTIVLNIYVFIHGHDTVHMLNHMIHTSLGLAVSNQCMFNKFDYLDSCCLSRKT